MARGVRSRSGRFRARLATGLACLAALPQVAAHVGDLWAGKFAGSAYEPRVAAILDVSRVGVARGPYLSVPAGDAFEPVDRKVNDLGFSSLAYAWGRITGRPATRRTLGAFNLVLLLLALGALIGVTPARTRWVVAPALLAFPLVVADYRSPDPLASHGSLSILALSSGAAIALDLALPWAAVLGALLFAIHKVRSAYALYGLAVLAAVALSEARYGRGRRVLLRLGVVLLAFAALETPWHLALGARDRDPRVIRQDTIGTHPVWIALIEGLGWSPRNGVSGVTNRWGLEPYDPRMASFMARRLGLPPVDVGTRESERRARHLYLSFLREDPVHVLEIYVSRLPGVAREHVALGLPGALLWIVLVPTAIALTWRARDVPLASVLAATGTMTACVLFQTVALDPRRLYAYPLIFLTALGLSLSVAAVAPAVKRVLVVGR